MGGFSTPAPPLPPAAGASISPKPPTTSLSPKAPVVSSTPPPLPVASSVPPPLPTDNLTPGSPVKTSPMPIVGSALTSSPPAENPLTKTLAMPDAPKAPMHFALAEQPAPLPTVPAPPPLVPASIPPAINEERGKIAEQASFLRNAMPTSPASFAPPAGAPLVAGPISEGRQKKTGLVIFAGAFAATILVVAAVLWAVNRKAPTGPEPTASTSATAVESATTTTTTTQETATATAAPTTTTAATTTATATATATTAPTATATAAPTATTAPAIAGLSPTKGAIVTGKSARQHRVYVDDKIVGEGPGSYVVACGSHTVKIGSSGKPLDLDVPCNGHVDVP